MIVFYDVVTDTVKSTGTVSERWEYVCKETKPISSNEAYIWTRGGDSERFIFQAMLQQLPEHSVARVQINNLH